MTSRLILGLALALSACARSVAPPSDDPAPGAQTASAPGAAALASDSAVRREPMVLVRRGTPSGPIQVSSPPRREDQLSMDSAQAIAPLVRAMATEPAALALAVGDTVDLRTLLGVLALDSTGTSLGELYGYEYTTSVGPIKMLPDGRFVAEREGLTRFVARYPQSAWHTSLVVRPRVVVPIQISAGGDVSPPPLPPRQETRPEIVPLSLPARSVPLHCEQLPTEEMDGTTVFRFNFHPRTDTVFFAGSIAEPARSVTVVFDSSGSANLVGDRILAVPGGPDGTMATAIWNRSGARTSGTVVALHAESLLPLRQRSPEFQQYMTSNTRFLTADEWSQAEQLAGHLWTRRCSSSR